MVIVCFQLFHLNFPFTKFTGLRLLGIGRNQYIDLMNQSRSGRKLFRKRNARELLPLRPVAKMIIEPWWVVHPGSITEDDIKVLIFRKLYIE